LPGGVSGERFCKEVIDVQHEATSPPQPTRCLALTSLWLALPEENRQQALQILRRVLAQQLPASPRAKEVTHEQD
jgi:hypothetical protein